MALNPEQVRDVMRKTREAREQKRLIQTPEQEKAARDIAVQIMRVRQAKQRGML